MAESVVSEGVVVKRNRGCGVVMGIVVREMCMREVISRNGVVEWVGGGVYVFFWMSW